MWERLVRTWMVWASMRRILKVRTLMLRTLMLRTMKRAVRHERLGDERWDGGHDRGGRAGRNPRECGRFAAASGAREAICRKSAGTPISGDGGGGAAGCGGSAAAAGGGSGAGTENLPGAHGRNVAALFAVLDRSGAVAVDAGIG